METGNEIISSYKTPLFVTAAYLCSVKLLSAAMKYKRPFSLKSTIAFYNLLQISMNVHLMYLCFSLMGMRLFRFFTNVCSPVSAVNDALNVRSKILFLLAYFYVNKIIDLFDTIFFLLRKKDSQVTFLHVFHHSTVLVLSWIDAFIMKEELLVQIIWINAFVHTVMYFYYLLASMGPTVRKFLWWKKYLTTMQIIQFLVILSMLFKMILEGCRSHTWFVPLLGAEISVLLILFLNFYKETYAAEKIKQK